jgi:DNA-binding XRE family transcriptional regulator
MNHLDIIGFRKKHNLTQKDLALKIGVSPNTIYNYENNGVIPKAKITLFEKLFKEYDSENHNINILSEPSEVNVYGFESVNASIMEVPLVNQYAYGGYLNGFSDSEWLESLPRIPFIIDKEYKGNYLCFEVKGDSMENDGPESIPEGSILLCRNIRSDYWKSKLHINKWDFVIVHKEFGIVVKRIIDHNVASGELTLHSLNDYYQDFKINLQDVKQIFNIVEIQSKRKRR